MNLKRIALLFIVLACAACLTATKKSRALTSLSAEELNGLGARLLGRPGSLVIEASGDGHPVLISEVTLHFVAFVAGSDQLSRAASGRHEQQTRLPFAKDQVAQYAAALDAFLKRAVRTSAADPSLGGEFARLRTWRAGRVSWLTFTFHGGAEMRHFLAIAVISSGGAPAETQYFDLPAARGLKQLLLAFAADSVPESDLAGTRH